MPARDEILTRIRQQLPQSVALPDGVENPIVYPDLKSQFSSVLESVGGRCVTVADVAAANAVLNEVPEYAQATQRVSCVSEIGESNFELSQVDDPHMLSDIDYAVLPGMLAVAENAAIWVETDDVPQRTLYFLTQHLSIILPANAICSNLHEAYQRISIGSKRFGTFVSGPSKTADIEQALVIGAHGARSLTVIFVESPLAG